MMATGVETAAKQASNLASFVLWPLSCMQWCSPALARPALNVAAEIAVEAFAAAAALSVFGCGRWI